MSQAYITFVLTIFLSFSSIYGYSRDSGVNVPSFEERRRTVNTAPVTSQFQASNQPPKQIYHANVNQKPTQETDVEKHRSNNITFSEFIEALKGPQHRTNEQFLQPGLIGGIGRDNENPGYIQYSPQAPTPYGYSRPNYAPPPAYHNSPAAIPPEPASQPKISLLKPDLSSLLHPIKTKVSDKLGGLLSLVLSLLSSFAVDGKGLSGIKDVLIDGILKPILTAAGGIKVLVSKLVVPVIALLLINVEVFVVVWWLWEECPERIIQPQAPQNYSQKPSYDYATYK